MPLDALITPESVVGYRPPPEPAPEQAWEYRESPEAFAARQDAFARQQAARQAGAIARLYESSRIADAEKAISTAIRFQGLRGYEQDIRSGLTPEQALLRNGPRMFYSHPSAIAPMMRESRPAFVPQWVAPTGGVPGYFRTGQRGSGVSFPPASTIPFEPSERTLPSGTKLIETSRGRYQQPRAIGPTRVLNEFERSEMNRLMQQETSLATELDRSRSLLSPDPAAQEGWLKLHQPDLERLATIRQRLEDYRTKAAGSNVPVALPKAPAPKAPTTAAPAKAQPRRVSVIGPKGQKGTVPHGAALPPGWRLLE